MNFFTKNGFDFFDYIYSIKTQDQSKSSDFSYDEMIYAAYANYNNQWKKFSLQAGLRMENTNSHGQLFSTDPKPSDDVKRNYVDLFPSVALTYNVNKKTYVWPDL